MSPDTEQLVRWAKGYGVLGDDDDLDYALHAALHAAFGRDLAPKPFAFLRPLRRPPRLLAYSASDPATLREHAAAFAEPEVADRVLRLDGLASKAMPEAFARGRRLGFSVRVRPMLRMDRDGNRNRSREIDVFLAATLREPGNNALDRGAIYAAWLGEQLRRGGAVPEHLTLASFRRTRVLRRAREADGRALRRQEGPEASFDGVLTVAEPEAFAGLLARGIGRHRAFGFGMLLLRPA